MMVANLYSEVRKISPNQRLFNRNYLVWVSSEIDRVLSDFGFKPDGIRLVKDNDEYSSTRGVIAGYQNKKARIEFVSAHRKSDYGSLKIDDIEMFLDLENSGITLEQRRNIRTRLDRFFPKNRFN